jgi:DNA-binding beta-propeller fold protein YncE
MTSEVPDQTQVLASLVSICKIPKEIGAIIIHYYLFAVRATTMAGDGDEHHQDGTGVNAGFDSLTASVMDVDKNRILFTDEHTVRSYELKTSRVTTIAGTPRKFGCNDGSCSQAKFHFPQGIAIDPSDQTILVADTWNSRIVNINETKDTITTIAGDIKESSYFIRVRKYDYVISNYKDGHGSVAQLDEPRKICCDSKGNIFVLDYRNNKIRKLSKDSDSKQKEYIVSTLVLNEAPAKPISLAMDINNDSFMYLLFENKILQIDLTTRQVLYTWPIPRTPTLITFDSVNGGLYASIDESIYYFNTKTGEYEKLNCNVEFKNPIGIEVDHNQEGGALYVLDIQHYKIFKLV